MSNRVERRTASLSGLMEFLHQFNICGNIGNLCSTLKVITWKICRRRFRNGPPTDMHSHTWLGLRSRKEYEQKGKSVFITGPIC